MTKFSTCKRCGETIRWARTCYGRPIPLVHEPMPNGRLVFRDDGRIVAWLPGMRLPRFNRHECPPDA